MNTSFRELTNEFDTLVTRGMRQGFLDPTELLDVFEQFELIAPTKAEQIKALAFHLCNIPPQFFGSKEITLIHQLDALPYAPLPSSGGFQAAWLEENEHLGLEMPFGKVSVLHLATHLSFLCHYYLQSLEATGSPGEFAGEDISPEIVAETFELPAQEVHALFKATEGRLEKLLCGELLFPEIHVHASLTPTNLHNIIRQEATTLLKELSERGLGKRPLHLWFGNDLPTYFLSPFIRDMSDNLQQWAANNFDQLGPDLLTNRSNLETPDFTLAVALDFLATNEELLSEMQQANGEVGISHRNMLGHPYEVIDCARLDYSAVDPRIRPHSASAQGPVILRLPHLLADEQGELLRAIANLAGNRIAGVTIAMSGTHLGHSPGSILLPDLALRWEGERKIAFPARSRLAPNFPDNPGGVLLTGPCGPLLSGRQIQSLTKELRIAGITLGYGGLLEALADCLWSGLLTPQMSLQWPLVAQQTTLNGRPDLASLDGWAKLIEAVIRPILGRAKPKAEPKQQTSPKQSSQSQKQEQTKKKRPKPKVNYGPPSSQRIQDLSGGPVLPPPGFEGNQPSPPRKPHNGRKLRIKA